MSRHDPDAGLHSGLWSYRSSVFAAHDDVMWIDAGRHRIITFVVIKVDPVKRAQMRTWYRPESPGSIRAGLKPRALERIHEFRLENDVLIWRHPTGDQPWRRLETNESPDWLEAEVTSANAKMDEMERTA
jgi:hypothetical protein